MEKEIEIIALEFPENVRTRPGMYIGTTDKPDVILREVIDNTSDELMGSKLCDFVDIQLKEGKNGGWYVISDNGRGIPIIWDEFHEKTKCELAVGSLHAGSKFHKTSDQISVGLNGVGVSCTNALSERFVILSKITEDNARKSIPDVEALYNQPIADELFYSLEFNKGIKVSETAATKKDIEDYFGFKFPDNMSTVVAFIPDPTIWDSIEAKYSSTSLAYLHVILDKFYNKNARIIIDGVEISNLYTPYKYEFIKKVDVYDKYKNKNKVCNFYVSFELDPNLDVRDEGGSVNSLVVNKGIHLNYVRNAFTESLANYFKINHRYLDKGLKMVVIAICGEVSFSSQTKENCVSLDNLYSNEVTPILSENFYEIFANNLEEFQLHVERLEEYARSIENISTIQKLKNMVNINDGTRNRVQLPTNVIDAGSRDRSECELYICEGKSAAGTIIQARNPDTQAILGLRGVPMNAINRDLDSILENEEFCSIISAIGCGVNEYHSLENPRYGKIIVAADADADGGKIASLVVGFFAKKMTFMLNEGMIYVLNSPLYRQGDKLIYPTDDVEAELDRSKPFQRYKGLGEISTEEAMEFITGDNRNLIQLTPENVDYALKLLTESKYKKELMTRKGILTDPYNTGVL